ncbi:MAG: sugar phosphate isomerase/epimerase family protein [Opitutales bacterium]
MKSCVTISLVPSLRGGPWILWDDLATSCRKAADLGFDAVELFTEGPSAGQRGELTAMLGETGLALGAVGTGAGKVIRGLTLTDPNPEIRTKARAFVADMIAFGGQHNAPAIIGSMQGTHGGEVSKEQALTWLAEALEELGEVALASGVQLIYEPLNRYETNLFNRFVEAASFLDGLTTKGVTLLADLFHMNIEEENIADSLRQGARHVGHVHFADSNRRPVGHGHTLMEPIADALREIGYDGCISAEAFDWPDPDAAAKQTIESYRKYFG